jgi:phosphatidylserine/phosphatidylglycerophosphate/cardiolipin synthase-like enzyme
LEATLMTFKSIRLTALILTLLLSACGGTIPAIERTSSGFEAASWSDDPIAPSFNIAYRDRVAANEEEAKRSPYNTHQTLFRIIQRSKESLDGAFFDIDAADAVDEIIAAKRRGVRVRLVTDSDNTVDKIDPSKPREAILRLRAAGIPVIEDRRSGFMHHKFMVLDGHTVWTGSTNLTPTSLYHHNNNALTIRSKELASVFSAEFERMFTDRAFGISQRTETAPSREMAFKNGSVQAYFSPRGGGRQAVLDEVDKAKKRIRLMTFSFTDVDLGLMIHGKAHDGVKVDGVFDRWLAAGRYSLYSQFKADGLNVWLDGNEALMHHKVIVIDDDTVITGSFNFSQNAEANNNEALLIIRNAPGLVKAYDDEFNRLVHAAKNNRPPSKKPRDPELQTGDVP